MNNTNKEASRITYGRLDGVLTEIGFVRRKTDAFTVYREADHDALIVLPNMHPDSDVGDPHLVAVRNTVTLKGVTSADRFQALLVSPRSDHHTSRTRLQTYKHKLRHAKSRKPSPKRLVKDSVSSSPSG